MEEFVKKQRIRAVTIGAQGLYKLGHPQVQALEVIRATFRRFYVYVVASRASYVANPSLVSIFVEYRHFTRRVGENRTADFLGPGDHMRRVFSRSRGLVVATPAQAVERQLRLVEFTGPHEWPVRAVWGMTGATGAASLEVFRATAALVMSATLDCGIADMAGGANLSAIRALAHEWLDLGLCPIRTIQMRTVTRSTIDVAVFIERELRRPFHCGNGYIPGRRHTQAVTVILAVLPHGS
jgi:hypothetical protein